MKKLGFVMALALAAGAAQAKEANSFSVLSGHGGGWTGSDSYGTRSLLAVDVTGVLSIDPYGDPLNVVLSNNIGAGSHVTGIGWDVTLFADSPSWLSEMVVSFESSSVFYVQLTPGVGDNISGTKSYSSGGVVDLIGLGLDFYVDGDGLLHMEFFEGFDDFANDWDGIWQSGTITVQYEVIPAPGALALMAGGGLVALRRRR
ncbi:MAG: hypothetical protein L6Q35_08480 [Phycisphaerales bacterium]|nr:hypothetical protein [Phycisphaerales bacterium]